MVKGLDLQSALVESEHSLYNLAAMALISAIHIRQLVQARDGQNNLKMEMAFTKHEQQPFCKLTQKWRAELETKKFTRSRIYGLCCMGHR